MISGTIEIRSHSHNVLQPDLLTKYTRGDIIGFEKGDFAILHHIETWTACVSPQAEILIFTQEEMKELWEETVDFSKQAILGFLKIVSIFKEINEQSLRILCYEEMKIFEISKEKSGEVILFHN